MVLHTTVGDIDIELFAREAPRASRRFVQLALEHYYDGAPFARIVRDFIAQIGDADTTAHINQEEDILAISGLQPLKVCIIIISTMQLNIFSSLHYYKCCFIILI